jgi:ribosome-binding ATPase YchF (GTP1/OBG family)
MSTRKQLNSRQYEICRKALNEFNKNRPRELVLAAAKKSRESLQFHLENDESFKQKYIEAKRRAGLAGNTAEAILKRKQNLSKELQSEAAKRGHQTLKNSDKYEGWLNKISQSSKDRKWYNNGTEEIKSLIKPEGFDEGRLYIPRPQSQVGEKNSNATKVVNIDNMQVFGTMKQFCSAYNLKTYELRNFMSFYNIKRNKVIEISLEKIKEFLN